MLYLDVSVDWQTMKSTFSAEHWVTHICSGLPGSHSPPRGKHSRHADTLHVFSINGTTACHISAVAQDFVLKNVVTAERVINRTSESDCS
jgi:hypothetical protein